MPFTEVSLSLVSTVTSAAIPVSRAPNIPHWWRLWGYHDQTYHTLLSMAHVTCMDVYGCNCTTQTMAVQCWSTSSMPTHPSHSWYDAVPFAATLNSNSHLFTPSPKLQTPYTHAISHSIHRTTPPLPSCTWVAAATAAAATAAAQADAGCSTGAAAGALAGTTLSTLQVPLPQTQQLLLRLLLLQVLMQVQVATLCTADVTNPAATVQQQQQLGVLLPPTAAYATASAGAAAGTATLLHTLLLLLLLPPTQLNPTDTAAAAAATAA